MRSEPTFIKEYKGSSIYLDKNNGKFYGQFSGMERTEEFADMKKLEDYITKLEKKKFDRFEAWADLGGRWNEDERSYVRVTVTSLDLRSRWRVSYDKSSEIVGEVYPCDYKHQKLVEQINAKRKQRCQLYAEIQALEKQMDEVAKEKFRKKPDRGEE